MSYPQNCFDRSGSERESYSPKESLCQQTKSLVMASFNVVRRNNIPIVIKPRPGSEVWMVEGAHTTLGYAIARFALEAGKAVIVVRVYVLIVQALVVFTADRCSGCVGVCMAAKRRLVQILLKMSGLP